MYTKRICINHSRLQKQPEQILVKKFYRVNKVSNPLTIVTRKSVIDQIFHAKQSVLHSTKGSGVRYANKYLFQSNMYQNQVWAAKTFAPKHCTRIF